MSDMLRITGLVSGMDTDSMVKKLIEIEQIKVDKTKQEKQYLEWQKEDYREVANSLRSFNDEYFDYLTPKTNLRSTSTFNMFKGTATSSGSESTAVSITTSSSSQLSSFTIDSITQLATQDLVESGVKAKGNITTGTMSSIANINTKVASNNKLSFTFDGVTKEIALDQGGYADYDAFAADLSAKLQDAFENVDITAEATGSTLEFKIYRNGTTTEEEGHAFSVGSTNSDLLTAMDLVAGDSNLIDTSKTLASVYGKTGDSTFTINGEAFTFSSSTTIDDVIKTVNEKGIGVTMSYDKFTDKFKLESTEEGTAHLIDISADDGLLTDMKLYGVDQNHVKAKDAIFSINGTYTTRASNSVVFEGSTISLNETTATAINVNVESDPTDVKDMIVKFVAKYNEVIKSLNDKTNENRNRDYAPLTDDQKKAMSEDDIKSWEVQARLGTLSNDSTLESITRNMRQALYEKVEGLDINLADIGIQTSSNYKEAGKLVIDEIKLDKALKERPSEVIDLFTKESETEYRDTDNRLTRTKENGLAARIHDILQDNIRITRDDKTNKKGYLIEKAGNESGIDTTSYMAKKITEMDDKIDRLLDLLADKEEAYYREFAAMESAMSSYQSQSNWLAQQLG